MPGRPLTMLRKVEAFEVAADKLASAVLKTIPAQYQKSSCAGDFIAETWRDARDAAIRASLMIGDLGEALREKAGVRSDCPDAGRAGPVEHPSGSGGQSTVTEDVEPTEIKRSEDSR